MCFNLEGYSDDKNDVDDELVVGIGIQDHQLGPALIFVLSSVYLALIQTEVRFEDEKYRQLASHVHTITPPFSKDFFMEDNIDDIWRTQS